MSTITSKRTSAASPDPLASGQGDSGQAGWTRQIGRTEQASQAGQANQAGQVSQADGTPMGERAMEPTDVTGAYRAFYGDDYDRLLAVQRQMDDLVDAYVAARSDSDDLKPVVYHTSRIKSPQSLAGKLVKLGEEPDFATALKLQIHDVVGARVICAFNDDVYDAARWLEALPYLNVVTRKDYIAHPKPNGYRSLHLVVSLSEGPAAGFLPLEIQLRTIAIDFWATLEHKMKYKKAIANEDLMRAELKRCADEIASVDLSMQTLRNAIRSAEDAG